MSNYRQSSPPDLAPISASIPRYCFDNDKYWYIIEAVMEDGRHWELSRFYQDFYDFQIELLASFEEEAGNKGKPRTLPYMPGPVTYVTDAISNGRRQNLDDYIKKLLAMPPHISRCSLIRRLFAPRQGDYEMDPNAAADDYRLSGTTEQSHSSNAEATQTASRQSSKGQLSGGPTAYATTASRAQQSPHHRNQSQSTNLRYSSQQDLQPPPMNRQLSNITQGSNASSSMATPTSAGPTSSAGAMKIKVFFGDDIIAIRVPSDITFEQLLDKLQDRLKLPESDSELVVQYEDKSGGGYVDIISESDWDRFLAAVGGGKVQLYVGVQ